MRTPLFIIFVLMATSVVVHAENSSPLLGGNSENATEWEKRMEEFKKPQFPQIKKYPKPFHAPNAYTYTVKDVCTACHTYASHKKDKKYSPFYNAHSTYISCNTCHFTSGNITYKWADIRNGNVVKINPAKETPYGISYTKLENTVILSGEDSTARITPYMDGEPVEIPLEGNKYLLTDVKSIAKMHNVLTSKPYTCDDCHKPGGKLDFKALGFSEERIHDLEKNEIVEGLKKYKKLHFPKFLWKR